MLVLVKEPRIRAHVTDGVEQVVSALKQVFGDVSVINDDGEELVFATETDWYKETKASMHPGKYLRIYRENAGLTQKQLAEKSGVYHTHISAMEHGKRAIGVISAKKLAGILGCNYRRLL